MADTNPVHRIRHRNARAAIWRNEGTKGTFFSVTFERGYKDGDGWRSSESFGLYDLLDLVRCVLDAYRFIDKARSDAEQEDAA